MDSTRSRFDFLPCARYVAKLGAARNPVTEKDLSAAVPSRRKNEQEEASSLDNALGLHSNALRLQLRWSTIRQVYFGCFPNSNASDDTDNSNYSDNSHDPYDSHDPHDAYDSADDTNNSDDADNSHDSVRTPGPCADPAARNEREAESRHPSRSGRVDDLSELNAHQSSTRNSSEHRQRPVHRWIRQLPSGKSGLPDGRRLGHNLESLHRCVQHHTSSFRRLL